MEREILKWEAEIEIAESVENGLSDEQCQSILDIIYGKGMFKLVDEESFKERHIENIKKTISMDDLGFLRKGMAIKNYIV
jgi:hypothetical protein